MSAHWKAFWWTFGILLVAGLISLIAWGIYAYNVSENNKDLNCHDEGGRRVTLKNGSDGVDSGTYCVNIIYKE